MKDRSRFARQKLPLAGGLKDSNIGSLMRPAACGSALAYEETLHDSVCLGVSQNPFTAPAAVSGYGEPWVHPRHGYFMHPDGPEGKSAWHVYQAYQGMLPTVVSRVLEVAQARDLLPVQALNLACAAAVQEYLLLAVVEHLRPRPTYPISVEGIRTSLFELPIDLPFCFRDLQPERLVAIRAAGSKRRPTLAQCELLEKLGFVDGIYAAVQFDRNETWRQLEHLEGLVRSEQFTARLPGWGVEPSKPQVGFNEIAFGLAIRESYSP